MPNCHHDILPALDPYTLIIDMFVNGLLNSFSHCLMMCGPIAIAQVSIRMMNIPAKKVSEVEKFKAAMILPYYFGKATTYSLLGCIFLLLKESFKDVLILKYAAVAILMFTGVYFLLNSFKNRDIFDKVAKLTALNKFSKLLVNKTQHLSPYGWQGFILGMCLGLLPCGLVMGMIVTSVSSTDNFMLVMLAMFTFGMGTIPGLFIVSYLGNSIVSKLKKYYMWLYSIMMFFNCYLMIRYALQLL